MCRASDRPRSADGASADLVEQAPSGQRLRGRSGLKGTARAGRAVPGPSGLHGHGEVGKAAQGLDGRVPRL